MISTMEYETKDERIKQYHALAMKEQSRFKHFAIQRVPQDQNEKSDRLVRLASSVLESLNPEIFIECLPRPSTKIKERKEVNMAIPEPELANQIMKYLKSSEFPEDKDKD